MMRPYPQRKSPRLQGYDYSQSGAYFVTICTYQRACRLGDIQEGILNLSSIGMIAGQQLVGLPGYWQTAGVEVDFYVVMPNHVHAIIVLDHAPKQTAAQKDTDRQKPVPTLGMVVGNYKAGVTRLARDQGFISNEDRLWQDRYHDHIIRNEDGLNRIRSYVETNPARWSEDTFYAER